MGQLDTRPLAADLMARLPAVAGTYARDVALAPVTWFRVGGPAQVLFRPADLSDLAAFLAAKPSDVPVMVLGVGSNLLVRDGGVAGVVIRLGRAFSDIRVEGRRIIAGAAALDQRVSQVAQGAGLAGFEFLRGIPGTIGGALRMNGGAHGGDMAGLVVRAVALDGQGRLHELDRERLGFSYRHCAVPADWIFVEAEMEGRPDEARAIAARMERVVADREASQPIRSRTGGSTFRNPPGAKAWTLIDAAGCRGLAHGRAHVSELHCNFLINDGDATAAEIEALGEDVRARVLAQSGIALDWEIVRVGVPS
ncbi:UDP-N-acetylmuramate dehydrogenase [Zavarzinia sp. CC-PAN008]|uniref:UDP-N-acetylmuramate dehydrogenase n=1 Tax=Zavarzinia sp. CC-PAN008 TaxID=3243332 RepID=UPI003F748D1B